MAEERTQAVTERDGVLLADAAAQLAAIAESMARCVVDTHEPDAGLSAGASCDICAERESDAAIIRRLLAAVQRAGLSADS